MRLSVMRDCLSLQRGGAVALSCVVAAWFVSAAPASATTISVVPSDSSVTVGDTFSVDFLIDGVTDLNEFVFGFYFNKTILSYDSVSEGTFLSQVGATTFQEGFYDALDPVGTTAAVLFNSVSLDDPLASVSGSGLLLTATFIAIAEGITDISAVFDNFIFADGLYDSTGNLIAFDVDPYMVAGSVTVSAPPTTVPEPGTLLLLSAGLAATAARPRKRKRPGPSLS